MMYFVLDTHPFFWSLFAEHRLTPRVRSIFQQVGGGEHTLYIPAIVLTELMLIVERRCAAAKYAECVEALQLLKAAGNYLFLPLMPDTVIASYALSDIPDIFDRLIAAEARRLRRPLITCDPMITSSGLVDTLWE